MIWNEWSICYSLPGYQIGNISSLICSVPSSSSHKILSSTQMPWPFIWFQLFFLSKWIKVDLGLHFLDYARVCSGQFQNLNLWNKGLGMSNNPQTLLSCKRMWNFIHKSFGDSYSFGLQELFVFVCLLPFKNHGSNKTTFRKLAGLVFIYMMLVYLFMKPKQSSA